jgi:hypothetical protein
VPYRIHAAPQKTSVALHKHSLWAKLCRFILRFYIWVMLQNTEFVFLRRCILLRSKIHRNLRLANKRDYMCEVLSITQMSSSVPEALRGLQLSSLRYLASAKDSHYYSRPLPSDSGRVRSLLEIQRNGY